jgi:streptomycin 6-kinase
MINESPADTALSRATIRWALQKPSPRVENATAWVCKVFQANGTPATLKLLKPEAREDELRGASLLAWYEGEGAANVLATAEDAILMEWVEGEPLGNAVRAGHDADAALALCGIVQELHRPRGEAPANLLPLGEHFRALFDAGVGNWPNTSRDLYARAVGIALQLSDRPVGPVPLHGDLHHDNVIATDRGWLAVDPKGLIGDPVYEVANLFINPVDLTALCADVARIDRLSRTLAERLGFERKRVLGYAVTHAALSACWRLRAGEGVAHHLAILPKLLSAYDLA